MVSDQSDGAGLSKGPIQYVFCIDMKTQSKRGDCQWRTLTATAAGCRTSRVGGGPPGTSRFSAEELRRAGGRRGERERIRSGRRILDPQVKFCSHLFGAGADRTPVLV